MIESDRAKADADKHVVSDAPTSYISCRPTNTKLRCGARPVGSDDEEEGNKAPPLFDAAFSRPLTSAAASRDGPTNRIEATCCVKVDRVDACIVPSRDRLVGENRSSSLFASSSF